MIEEHYSLILSSPLSWPVCFPSLPIPITPISFFLLGKRSFKNWMSSVQLFSCGLWLLERRLRPQLWPNNPWKPFPKCISLRPPYLCHLDTGDMQFQIPNFSSPAEWKSLQDSKDFCRFVHCYFSSVLFGVISLVFRTMPRTHVCVQWGLLEGRGKEGRKEGGQMNFTQWGASWSQTKMS